MAKFGDKPGLVSLYSKAAALAFEPALKATGEVSYETSLGQVKKQKLLRRNVTFKTFARNRTQVFYEQVHGDFG